MTNYMRQREFHRLIFANERRRMDLVECQTSGDALVPLADWILLRVPLANRALLQSRLRQMERPRIEQHLSNDVRRIELTRMPFAGENSS